MLPEPRMTRTTDLPGVKTPPESAQTAKLWRCATCEKWSHAKRRPSSHTRWIRAFPLLTADVRILHHEPAGEVDNPITGDVESSWPDQFEVVCGPFEAWTATRDGAA